MMIGQFISVYAPYIALLIMALTFVGFTLEELPVEVTASVGAAAFVLLGFVSPADAYSVFSNPAPLTIAAMFVLTGALVRTGVLERVVGAILDFAGDRPAVAIISLFVGLTVIGGFVNNTPLVLILIPVALRIAKKFNIPSTRLLIPISYVTILAGTLTLIGTSTILIVDGVARESGLEPFSIFEITPVGIVTVLSGLILLGLFSRFLLPDRPEEGAGLGDEEVAFLSEFGIQSEGSFTNTPLGSISALKLPGLRVLGVKRAGKVLREDLEDLMLRKQDRLIVMATSSQLLTLSESKEVRIGLSRAGASRRDHEVVEAVLGPQRAIIGERIGALRLGSRFGVQVIGIHRHNHVAGKDLASAKLRPADRLLLKGPAAGLDAMSEQGVLVSVTRTSGRAFRRSKAPIVLLALLGVIVLSALKVMDIGILAMLAVVGILVLRCIDSAEAWGTIDGGILVLIFTMLIMGLGLQQAGTIELIVSAISPLMVGLSPLYLLIVVYLLTSALTELITNNAVAVVMTPIVIGLAAQIGADPRPLVVAVMFAASASFATPIGYQTNTLVYAAGNYKFMDFVKVGLPMNIVVGIATCAAIYWYYGM